MAKKLGKQAETILNSCNLQKGKSVWTFLRYLLNDIENRLKAGEENPHYNLTHTYSDDALRAMKGFNTRQRNHARIRVLYELGLFRDHYTGTTYGGRSLNRNYLLALTNRQSETWNLLGIAI